VCIVETDDGVGSPALAAVSCAQQLAEARGAELHIVAIGSDTSAAATLGCPGVAAVHTITDSAFAEPVAELYTSAALSALATIGADVVIGPASSTGKDYLPRVAEALGAGMVTDALSVEGPNSFTRPLWAGSVIGTVETSGDKLVLSVRGTAFDPAEQGEASPHALEFSAPSTLARFVSREQTVSARPSLSEANAVVSGGRGTKGDFAPIETLADALNAGMGASRAACDAGWVPNDLQVGQTGKVVAPSLYIAAGISGAIQHIAGMKGSKTIVAINKDAEAPIFAVADYGLVADLFDVCPEMAQKISEKGLKII
jgi:electron transfer flavoprotein alpha subunit